MRLISCDLCKTLEEVPDWIDDSGVNRSVPERSKLNGSEPDLLIEEIVRRHNERDPMGHGGAQLHHSPMRIAYVADAFWSKDKAGVLNAFNAENKRVGHQAWFYEALNTFEKDALRCWRQHRRPKEGEPCIDFWSDSKRIGRPSSEGRRFRKENYKAGERDPHLCQFCPYYSVVQTEVRFRAGLYKDR